MIIFQAILSLWTWFFLVFFTIFYVTIGVILGIPLSFIFDRRRSLRILQWIAVMWAKSTLLFCPFWRLRVEGQDNIERGKHYIVVGNHQSMLDIFAALAGLPLHFKFMAKKELFSIPFLGWHMTFAGYIPINRSSPQSGKEALERAKNWLTKNISVLFFPEGTRSLDGEIKKFKAGAFRAAEETETEILPIVLDGTGDAVPKKSWMIKRTSVLVLSIGKPVKVSRGMDAETLCENVRQEMIQRLEGIRKT